MTWNERSAARRLVALAVAVACAVGCRARLPSGGGPSAPPVERAPSAEPAEPPPGGRLEPRLISAMHTDAIRDAEVDAAQRFLVTGSDDKTVRVWQVLDGALLQTLRMPIGGENEGLVQAVAISRDAQTVAAGGYTDAVFIFRREDGRLLQRIDGPNSVTALAFAPDADRLVAGFGSGGIRVYAPRAGRYEAVVEDSDYAGMVCALAFDRAGRLATSSLDRKVRLYDAHFGRTAVRELEHRPGGLAFSANGQRLAVGSSDGPYVELLDAALTPVTRHDLSRAGYRPLSVVAWTRAGAGEDLVAGGAFFDAKGDPTLAIWPAGKGGPSYLTGRTSDTVSALVPLAGGQLIVAGMDPKLTRLDAQTRALWTHGRPTADLRGQARTLAISPDGRHVRFGLDYVAGRTVVFPPIEGGEVAPIWQPPQTESLAVREWHHNEHPTLDGNPLRLLPDEKARSLAISSNAARFVLGADRHLRMYSKAGVELWRQATPSGAFAVNLSQDGRLLVAGLGDGTVRWYRAADGQLLRSLFHQPDSGHWVAWTPEGFFDASENGEELIGYHLNRGRSGTPVLIGVGQLRVQFHRPDLVAASISDDRSALDRAVAEVGDVAAAIERGGLPPRIQLIDKTLRGDELRVRYQLHDQGGGIGPVRFRINEHLVAPTRARAPGPAAPQGQAIYEQSISLQPGQNLVSLIASNAAGNLRSAPLQLPVVEQGAARGPRSLHVLAIGVSDYDDPDLRREGVKWAKADAQALGDTLQNGQEELFSRVLVTLLPNATLAQIKAAFRTLEDKVEPQDTFVLYLAGHGLARRGRYHFIPREQRELDDDALESGSLHEERLVALLSSIKAERSLVLLDTCSAGAALSSRDMALRAAVDRLHKESGRVFIAASADDEKAFELDYGHSAFAQVLLEALQGRANRGNDALVDVDELGDYVYDQLPVLTLEKLGRAQNAIRKGDARFPVSSGKKPR